MSRADNRDQGHGIPPDHHLVHASSLSSLSSPDHSHPSAYMYPTSDRRRGAPPMRANQPGTPHGRSPRRAPPPNPPPAPPDDASWGGNSQYFYNGSPADYHEDYAQNDQWPLPTVPQAPPTHTPGTARRPPPQRPLRPDESLQYPSHMRELPRNPPRAPLNQRLYQLPPPMPSHHGNGQWNGDGYTYAPPPDYPLPTRPLPPPAPHSSQDFPSIPPDQPHPQYPQQASLQQANRRAPLGPPPSARRGPQCYYPQIAPVHPIVEESDSMRGSTRGSTRTGSAHTGHNSKTSWASSNAIPIGISQFHLERGQSATHQPIQRPAPLTDSEDEELEDSPTDPAVASGEIRTPDLAPFPDSRPGDETIVRQASVGKKRKPNLTTVRSSNSVRKSSGTRIASQQHEGARDSTLTTATIDPESVEQSRAMAEEILTGQARPGAMEPIGVAHHLQSEQLPARAYTPSPTRQSPGTESPAVTAAAAYLTHSATCPPEPGPRTLEKTLPSAFDASSVSDVEGPELKRNRSKDLLGAEFVNQVQPPRSRPRSPLAPTADPQINPSVGNIEPDSNLGAEQPSELKQPMAGLSSERAGKHRPPRLNVDAVRDAEARGSLTSLPDLIRRATKLASNLDRGKTASRMGGEWLDGARGDEKMARNSEIIAAYATPDGGKHLGFRKSFMRWSTPHNRHGPGHGHGSLASESEAGDATTRRRPMRTCCGMPAWLFSLLLTLLVLLIAAAVVVPVVLIVLPAHREASTAPTKVGPCPATPPALPCENGGTDMLGSSGSCECACRDGWFGPTCGTFRQHGCARLRLDDGAAESVVSVGAAIPLLLDRAVETFRVPLEGRALLGLFDRAGMDCNMQNQLVRLDLDDDDDDGGGARRKREDGSVMTTAAKPTNTSTTPPPPDPDPDPASPLDFARIAILYVFQTSQDLHVAADAQLRLQAYFQGRFPESGGDVSSSSSTSSQAVGAETRVGLERGFWVDFEGWWIGGGDGGGGVVGGGGGGGG